MAIKWDKLTVKSQEAVQAASGYAAENGNPEVLPLHLMAALLEDHDGVVIPAMQKVLEQGFKEADNFKDDYVSTEHLLLALARQKGDAVQTALAALGATHEAILKALVEVRGAQGVTD